MISGIEFVDQVAKLGKGVSGRVSDGSNKSQ